MTEVCSNMRCPAALRRMPLTSRRIEPDANKLLQRFDLRANRRLRDTENGTGLLERALLRDDVKIEEVIEIGKPTKREARRGLPIFLPALELALFNAHLAQIVEAILAVPHV